MNPKCLVVLVALVAQVYSYPSTRQRRQAVAYAGPDGAVAGAGAGGKEAAGGVTVGSGSSSSSTSTSTSTGTNLGGNRLRDFVPWRVFAGLNLGQGARVGAGCAGLNCGVRLGDYSVGTGQLFGNRGSYEYDDDYSQGKGRQVVEANRRADNLNGTDTETSETFLTGVTLTERIDSVRGFLASLFRGVQDAISSLFRRPETRTLAPTLSTPASASSNRTYSIVLGTPSSAASEVKPVTVTLPSVVDNSENDVFKA